MLDRRIPIIFIPSIVLAPRTICQSNDENPIPIADRGGMRETHIATPGKTSSTFGFINA